MKFGPLFAAFLLASGAAGAAYWIKQPPPAPTGGPGGPFHGGRRGQTASVAPVGVAQVTKQTVPVYRDGIGNVQALNTVTVRSQVDGRLMSVEFAEGQDVKKGDVLARIDPVSFKALYDQAVGKKAQDQANLANARIDLERYTKLAKSNAGPQQQADSQASTVAQLTAQLASDQAAIDNAKATLDYATIHAPLDGRAGLRLVDPGNIVRASDQAGLVVITQTKPMGVLFTLPQRDLPATAAALARGDAVVTIPGVDGQSVDATGTLQSIDNQIDVTTGTIKLKASFPNEDLKLWPGQFVGVRVIVDQMVDAAVVPASAIRRGVDGSFVYAVGDDGKAHVVKVDVPLQNETLAVIKGSVAVGQTVVTEGFASLSDGKPVQVAAKPGLADKAGGRADKAGGKPQWPKNGGKNGKAATPPAGDAAATAGDAAAAPPGQPGEATDGKRGRRSRGDRSGAKAGPKSTADAGPNEAQAGDAKP